VATLTISTESKIEDLGVIRKDRSAELLAHGLGAGGIDIDHGNQIG
jgi:hypothetical protein